MAHPNIQSVLFDRAQYNEVHARNWLAVHGYKPSGKVHPTDRFLRFRQYEPRPYERYITKTPPLYPGVRLIVAIHGPAR